MKCEPMPDGRPLYYVLDADGNAVAWEGSLEDWAAHPSLQSERRILKTTRVDGLRRGAVVTAFWGMDDAAAVLRPAERPAVFGTLAGREWFDSTRAEALARHDRIVDKLQRGVSLDDEDGR